jgi:hypothetical protein
MDIRETKLTPEQIAEFGTAVDKEIDSFNVVEENDQTISGGRRRRRGGGVNEIKAAAKQLWMSVCQTVGTPENAGIALALVPAGLAAPQGVAMAFTVARKAIVVGAQAVTPTTFAMVSVSALLYYYFGEKLPSMSSDSLTQQMAIERMNKAISEAKKSRATAEILREVADKFKADLDSSKAVPWVSTEEELARDAKLAEDTAKSKIGNDTVAKVRSTGPAVGYDGPIQKPMVSPPAAPPAAPADTGMASVFSSTRRRGGSMRRRPSGPTRRGRRSSSSKRKRYTRRRRV